MQMKKTQLPLPDQQDRLELALEKITQLVEIEDQSYVNSIITALGGE